MDNGDIGLPQKLAPMHGKIPGALGRRLEPQGAY